MRFFLLLMLLLMAFKFVTGQCLSYDTPDFPDVAETTFFLDEDLEYFSGELNLLRDITDAWQVNIPQGKEVFKIVLRGSQRPGGFYEKIKLSTNEIDYWLDDPSQDSLAVEGISLRGFLDISVAMNECTTTSLQCFITVMNWSVEIYLRSVGPAIELDDIVSDTVLLSDYTTMFRGDINTGNIDNFRNVAIHLPGGREIFEYKLFTSSVSCIPIITGGSFCIPVLTGIFIGYLENETIQDSILNWRTINKMDILNDEYNLFQIDVGHNPSVSSKIKTFFDVKSRVPELNERENGTMNWNHIVNWTNGTPNYKSDIRMDHGGHTEILAGDCARARTLEIRSGSLEAFGELTIY